MGGAGVTLQNIVCTQKGEVAHHCPPKQEVRIPVPFLCSLTERNYIHAGFFGVLLIRKESVLVECFSR